MGGQGALVVEDTRILAGTAQSGSLGLMAHFVVMGMGDAAEPGGAGGGEPGAGGELQGGLARGSQPQSLHHP